MAYSYAHPDFSTVTLLAVLRALADPVRLELVRQIDALGEANCSTLLGNRPKSSMSHHFQVLRASGIICTRTEGVNYINSLRKEELDARFPGLMDSILAELRRLPTP
ncbi:helix-turn-helix domain-containing protein [Acetobacteraceae bacterium ESL0709]|nr:helix-turn-helix domain-containing protein [Acetobacteraceae bacterium ESL0697]MDF7677421.1 helix-turn-helix domain-containing protein [Acetobacteraceae bacterium ESL0709]